MIDTNFEIRESGLGTDEKNFEDFSSLGSSGTVGFKMTIRGSDRASHDESGSRSDGAHEGFHEGTARAPRPPPWPARTS